MSEEAHNDILLLERQWFTNERNFHKGGLSEELHNREQNRIVDALFWVIDEGEY